MKNLKILFIAGCFFSQTVFSQELVPATSEDQEIFNQQLEQAEKQNAELKSKRAQAAGTSTAEIRKANFGQVVAAEAKKLKDSTTAKKGIGSAISILKRKNQTQSQVENNSSSSSSGSSASKDGRNSAPRLNNTGGAPSQPGQSGNRNK